MLPRPGTLRKALLLRDVRDGWALQSPLRQQAVSAPTKLVCYRPLLHMQKVPSTPQVSRADQDPGVFAAGPAALL